MSDSTPFMGSGTGSNPSPPNIGIRDGDRGSTDPLASHATPDMQPNHGLGGDRRGGTMPLGGSASPIDPPNANPASPGHSGGAP